MTRLDTSPQASNRLAPRRTVHPFPARMAPEIALEKIDELTRRGQTVMDPMCGSGTVVCLASEHGRRAIGVDIDPLAVSITRTACLGKWSDELEERAKEIVKRAKRLGPSLPEWIARDAETEQFVSYWFAPQQAEDLSRLARVLIDAPPSDDPLRVALSRIIVTKEPAASLARDTSHSRPHRWLDENDFDVFEEYVKAARRLESLSQVGTVGTHRPSIRRDDARTLRYVKDASVHLTVTSPPYLNAIDYMRGHKLSLVWLGWTERAIREIRGESVGVERMLEEVDADIRQITKRAVPRMRKLPARKQGMVLRFTYDMDRLARALARATKRNGHLVMVVADSQLAGVPISNADICAETVERHGFELTDETVRPLVAQHRYLPPPSATTSTTLAKRMNDEIVFTFRRN